MSGRAGRSKRKPLAATRSPLEGERGGLPSLQPIRLNGKHVALPGRAEHNRRMPAAPVRPAALADAEGIGLVHVRSWQSAYRGKMPQDPLRGPDPARRAQAWRHIMKETDPSRGGVLVTVAESGAIIGFASFGPSRDSDTDPRG